MKNDFINVLPKKRTGGYLNWVSNSKIGCLILIGITIYLLLVLVISEVEFCSDTSMVINQHGNAANFYEILYFNFITVLTIGYGDLTPMGIGRILSIFESAIGVGVMGLLISFITAKLLAAPKNAIVFSKYGYYCTDNESFMIIFANTTNALYINAEMSSYFKLGGNWGVDVSIRSPFITRSVQTFYLEKFPQQMMIENLKDGDVLRFGINGTLGYASHSAAIEYDTEHIIVITNRNYLTSFTGFIEADFSSKEVREKFHYYPEGAKNLKSYIQSLRLAEKE